MMRKQHGVSLVEILVSMALGLMLVNGVIRVFVGSKQSFSVIQDIGKTAEGGRLATAIVGKGIRMADHWGGIAASDVDTASATLTSTASATLTSEGSGDCDTAWIFNATTGLEGFDGTSATPPLNCISADSYVANTDVLVVRYADGQSAMPSDALDESTNYVRVVVGGSAEVFVGKDTPPTPDQMGTYNMPFVADVFFVRPCSIKHESDGCKDKTPTLTQLSLLGDAYIESPLIEGVEQLQFEYGVDTDGDKRLDNYLTATQIHAAGNWDEVVSVRMSVVVLSQAGDNQVDASSKEFLLVGDMSTAGNGHTPDASNKTYRRRVYTRNIQVRNRVRSL